MYAERDGNTYIIYCDVYEFERIKNASKHLSTKYAKDFHHLTQECYARDYKNLQHVSEVEDDD